MNEQPLAIVIWGMSQSSCEGIARVELMPGAASTDADLFPELMSTQLDRAYRLA